MRSHSIQTGLEEEAAEKNENNVKELDADKLKGRQQTESGTELRADERWINSHKLIITVS